MGRETISNHGGRNSSVACVEYKYKSCINLYTSSGIWFVSHDYLLVKPGGSVFKLCIVSSQEKESTSLGYFFNMD